MCRIGRLHAAVESRGKVHYFSRKLHLMPKTLENPVTSASTLSPAIVKRNYVYNVTQTVEIKRKFNLLFVESSIPVFAARVMRCMCVASKNAIVLKASLPT